jgi:hypothetical protein
MSKTVYGHVSFGPPPYEGQGPRIEQAIIPPTRIVTWTDQWKCTHQVTIGEAARMLKEFYDAWPGGLEEIESAIKTARTKREDDNS